MLTVYGDIRSGNCLKVKWLLDWLGRDYRWVETDVMSGATRSPEFLARNPAGQVPAVVLEDGRVLAQSNAIIGLFGEGTVLVPVDAYDRARMYEWLFWEQYSHEPCIAVVRFQRLLAGKPADEIDPRLVTRGYAALTRMEEALIPSDWLVGAGPSLADLALVAYTRVAHEGDFDLSGYPAVRRWIGRVETMFAIR